MVRKRKKPVETEAEKLARWQNGADGFVDWIRDTKPMVPASKDGFTPFELSPEVEKEAREILSGKYRTAVVSMPRRHGKSALVALIIVWRFLTRRTQMIAICSNSQTQSVGTGFRLAKTVLEQTPYTKKMLVSGTIRILGDKIEYDAAGNTIQGFPSNHNALFGIRIDVAQVTELHAAKSQQVYNTVSSGTLDSADGLVLVDSTVGPTGSPLHTLYTIWKEKRDPALFYSYISYKNLEEALQKSPAWIDRDHLQSLSVQMLPLEFAQQHLNLWGSASNRLFPDEIIEDCKHDYALDVREIAGEAAFVVGAGLDRAYAFSTNGDRTITTCVLKTIQDDDEHFYVMASDRIRFSNAGAIKRAFTRYHDKFEMKRVAIENPNTTDIQSWCADQPFDHEVAHPTAERQSGIFTVLYNAASEGRLHIHPSFKLLLDEMETFEYTMGVGQSRQSIPKFKGAGRTHDDCVYSLGWSLYSLRNEEINPYEIEGIVCTADKMVAQMCILNGGEHVPLCSSECRSFQQIFKMYKSDPNTDKDLQSDLRFFVNNKVINTGAHVVQR